MSYPTLVPTITIKGALEALDFYPRAFGARERYRLMSKDGQTVMHAELEIGNGVIMLSDEFPQWDCLSPITVGGCPACIRINVEDVDAAFAQAIGAGATSVMEPADQFYGERSATLKDPFGYRWTLATMKEKVPDEEIEARFRKMEVDGVF